MVQLFDCAQLLETLLQVAWVVASVGVTGKEELATAITLLLKGKVLFGALKEPANAVIKKKKRCTYSMSITTFSPSISHCLRQVYSTSALHEPIKLPDAHLARSMGCSCR
jgi:hypothetical protein